jgi:hypothetical protein
VSEDRWETTPRMLQELCDGHPSYSIEVYALDLPNDVRLWLCKSCWIDRWHKYGRPEQLATRAGSAG